MAASQKESTTITRLRSILGFFIGIFGAAAILGVFFKILKLPNYETFMIIGFIGEAAAFVVMGIFELLEGASVKKSVPDEKAGINLASGGDLAGYMSDSLKTMVDQTVHEVTGSFRVMMDDMTASFRTMVQDQVSSQLNVIMLSMAKEAKHFGDEMQQMGAELERARGSVQGMRDELDKVVSGHLADDAERLGRGMNTLSNDMEGAGASVENMRNDLEMMLRRFRSFNESVPTSNTNNMANGDWADGKIKRLP